MSLEVTDDWEDLDSPEEDDFTDVLLTPVLAAERVSRNSGLLLARA